MSNSHNELGEDAGEQFSSFEKMLANRPLGAGRQKCGDLMYECGYAAGVAESRKQLALTTRRWRVTGFAASMIACASIVMQLRSFDSNGPDQLMVEQPLKASPAEDPAEVITPAHNAASHDWLAQLTTNNPTNGQNNGVLRASSSMEILNHLNEPVSEFTPDGPFNQESTLRPRDFQKFL